MADKVVTSIYIDREVLEKAKDLGLNISRICERALRDAIRRLETSLDKRTETDGGSSCGVVLRPGFEPGSGARKAVV